MEQNDEDAMTEEWHNDWNWNTMMKIELEMHKWQVERIIMQQSDEDGKGAVERGREREREEIERGKVRERESKRESKRGRERGERERVGERVRERTRARERGKQ